ncbi:MAG: hypothetical protein JXB48_12550 [Candidatus Latescibacteria bacterium]|nr:hypothetical protein [Candidatus Latescibacterota bacterium]
MNYRNEDFFQVFGRICIFFATLDFFVSEVIIRLIKTNRQIQLSENMTLGQKFKIISDLSPDQVIDPDILFDIKKILPEAIDVSRERNRYIHDQWVFNPELISKGKINRFTLNFPPQTAYINKQTELTINDLDAFLKRIGELQKKFGAFLDRLPSINNKRSEHDLHD